MILRLIIFLSLILIFCQQLIASSISGIVQDAITNEPLPSASIFVLNSKDSSIITGGKSNLKGKFSITNLKDGQYFLKISYIGYDDSQLIQFEIKNDNPADLGAIALSPTSTELAEIQIVADKPIIELSSGKKIFNVDKNLISTGGTALDIMKNIPSIDIDNDGNVLFRGSSNIKILIDGKTSSLFQSENSGLEKIPADMIEKIEIITNPSSRYDAEGVAGIINIILKKNLNSGFNSIFSLNAGTKDKYGASLNLDYDLDNFKLSGGYDFKSEISTMDLSIIREINESDINSANNSNQINNRRRKYYNHSVRTAVSYIPDKSTSYSISSLLFANDSKFTEFSNYNFFNKYGTIETIRMGDYKSSTPEFNIDLSASFNKQFSTDGNLLTVNVIYSKSEEKENTLLAYNSLNPSYVIIDSSFRQNTEYLEKYSNGYLEIIFQNNFLYFNLESGFKSSFRSNDGNYLYSVFDPTSSQWLDPYKVSNHFLYDEFIHAAFLILSRNIFDLHIELGLRVEHSTINTAQLTSGQKYSNIYMDFFPSISISRKFSPKDELSLNYSRRISRPYLHFLNPYVDMRDPYNIRYGNPDLLPEYIDSYEINYLTLINKLSLISTLYYRNTNQSMSRYLKLEENNAIGMTFVNIDRDYKIGMELGLSGELFPWWNINANFSYYYAKFDGGEKFSNITNENFQWYARLNSNFKIIDNLNFQLSGFYNAPTATLQGTRLAMYALDAGLKYDLFNNKLSLSLNWNDIFDIRKFRVNVYGIDFVTKRQFKRETSIINLNATYRLNTQKPMPRKIRDRETEPTDLF